MIRRPLPLLTLLFAIGSCIDNGQEERSAAGRFVENDSLGIRIADNRNIDVVRLRIAEEAGERLVAADGSNLVLSQVTGAVLTEEGIAIADNSSRSIVLVADSAVRTIGREGEGPGEFKNVHGLWKLADGTLATFDRTLQRLTILRGPEPEPQVVPVRPALSNPPIPVGVLSNGTGVIQETQFKLPEVGFERQRVLVKAFNGDTIRVVADVASARFYREKAGASIALPIFESGAKAAAAAAFVAVSTCTSPELLLYSENGNLLQIVRWTARDRKTSAKDVTSFIQLETRGMASSERRSEDARLRSLPVADLFPACDRMIAAPPNQLYVRSYQRPGDRWQSWRQFVDGRLVALLRVPPSVDVMSFHEDGLLAVERDDLDVEHLRAYEFKDSAVTPIER